MSKLMVYFHKKPIIKNTDETIQYIINHKCSVSRFGDGEFSILFGKNIAFQKHHPQLTRVFKEILSSNLENHITCLPYAIYETSTYNQKGQIYWKNYFANNSLNLFKYLNFSKIYYNSLFSRLYIDTCDKEVAAMNFTNIKKLWNNQNIVFIEGKKSRLGVGNDLFSNAKSIKRIISPSINAFDVYDSILDFVQENVDNHYLLLIALGPTATALAWDLSKLGYWAIDIGHIDVEYEWFLMDAKEKVPLPYKFVGDIFTDGTDSTFYNKEYEESILKRI